MLEVLAVLELPGSPGGTPDCCRMHLCGFPHIFPLASNTVSSGHQPARDGYTRPLSVSLDRMVRSGTLSMLFCSDDV